MITTIVSIGNSKGIRIPKLMLEESGISRDVELKAKKGEIRIIPITTNRKTNSENLLLSEKVLAADWNRQEEDEAWKSLQ